MSYPEYEYFLLIVAQGVESKEHARLTFLKVVSLKLKQVNKLYFKANPMHVAIVCQLHLKIVGCFS